MKAAIYTIGTEVADGEITNTNASWLATELTSLGFQVTHHLSTPDDLPIIDSSLKWLEPQVDWVFVTGGLGPTSDDKTREALANFAGVPLEFSDSEWERLQGLHDELGIKTREGHKHQCYFPKGATHIANPVGSAPGFRLTKHKTEVMALPGPPRELKGVFDTGLKKELSDLKLQKAHLRTWTLLGITESKAAEIVEEVFADQDVILGYRASVPYVHVKVWFNKYMQQTHLVEALEKKIHRFVVSKDGESPLQFFADALPPQNSIFILDRFSRGKLAARLSECAGDKVNRLKLLSEWESSSSVPEGYDIVMTITQLDTEVICSVISGGRTSTDVLRPPYKLDPQSARAQKYFVESAIYTWAKLLRAMSSTS